MISTLARDEPVIMIIFHDENTGNELLPLLNFVLFRPKIGSNYDFKRGGVSMQPGDFLRLGRLFEKQL